MAVGAVVARILTQYSDKGSKAAAKDIANLGKKFDAYSKKAVKAFGLVAAASAAAAVKIGKDAVMAASDVSQQFGALDAVFGSNAAQLKDFSKSMVDYGLSTADAARYAALLGTQLKGLGLSEQEAITRTKQLEILAADLAATYGGTTADAVQALSSTFKGEYNPIERYGVAIKKSDITARVAAKGLGKLKGDLLKAAEAQTAFEMIIAKTTAAQGQSRREYNTLAAQLQRVDAAYTNIKATLGMALLPVVEKFSDYVLKTVLPGLEKWVNVNKDELAKSLETAAQHAIKLFGFAVAFGNWVITHTDDIKTLSIIMASLWGTSKVYAFAKAIGTVTLAIRGMAAASAVAGGAGLLGSIGGAAGVGAAAAGAIPLAIAGGIAALTFGLSKISPGEKARANAKKAASLTGTKGISPRGNVNNKDFLQKKDNSVVSSDIQKIIDEYNKVTNQVNNADEKSKKKQLSAVQKMYNLKLKELGLVETTADIEKMATAYAIKWNLDRQARLSGSRTIAIGASGALSSGTQGNTTVVVNNAGSVISEENLVTTIVNGIERTTRRSFGTVGAYDRL